jgi:hypothetical protein
MQMNTSDLRAHRNASSGSIPSSGHRRTAQPPADFAAPSRFIIAYACELYRFTASANTPTLLASK